MIDFSLPLADDIFIDASVKYQTILGFGGAFTDAAGINIGKLSVLAQAQVIKYCNSIMFYCLKNGHNLQNFSILGLITVKVIILKFTLLILNVG